MRAIIAYKLPQTENKNAYHTGLGVTSKNTCNVLNEENINIEVWPVIDGYDLRNKLGQNTDITHVVMAAPFFDTSFLESLCRLFPQIKFTITYHSNIGFLAVDNWSTKVLMEQIDLQKRIKNFEISGNSLKFCTVIEHSFYNFKCNFLPNLYFLLKKYPKSNTSYPIKIGCFGAIRVLKNLPTAAWATKIISDKLNYPIEFWISSGRVEGQGSDKILENLEHIFKTGKVILKEYPWSDWVSFRKKISQMDLLMQPSFTESFNGVTADGIAEGVPSVVSRAITWTPESWKADSDSASDIAMVGLNLLGNPDSIKDGYKCLTKHTNVGVKHWKKFLGIQDTPWWRKLLNGK